jgi:hypothetical protein
MRRARLVAALAALVAFQAGSLAAQSAAPSTTDDVEHLRAELLALRAEYAARIAELETRLDALTAAQAAATPAPPPEPAPAPQPAAAAPSSKVFNPDIAVIGDFLGAAGKDPGPEPAPSLELHEAEASFQAIVDPYARADFFLAFSKAGVDVEEGYVSFPSLPGGLLLKAGKMRGAFGKVNATHNHALAWTDRPLVTRNLLGGEEGLSDEGLSLSRLIPNEHVFLELTGEVYRGASELYQGPRRQDLTWLGRVRAYRDLGESTNIDLGGSLAWGRDGRPEPEASTRLIGADATFRWRPLRRAIYRKLLARTELVWSLRRDAASPPPPSAFGLYVSAEYQFARRWYAGARYDRSGRADVPDLTDSGGSLLLTFWPSEFSQVRGQYRRIEYGEGGTANELLFQLLFSIGAHGAHSF